MEKERDGKEMKQYVKIKKDAIGAIEPIGEAHLQGLDYGNSKALVFIETEKELPVGKAIKFHIKPPGNDETYIAYGVVDTRCNGEDGNKPAGVAVTLLEVEKPQDKDPNLEAEEQEDDKRDATELSVTLPDTGKIKGMLDSLIGMEIEIEESEEEPSDKARSVTTFTTDSGAIGAVCVCDLTLTGAIGAVLDLVPPEELEQHIENGELPENIMNNFREAMNVAASLFNSENDVQLSSGEVLINPEKLNADINIVIKKASSRALHRITIPNYKSGIMALYAAP